MKVWRLEVDIHATMYVKADTAEEAAAIARDLKEVPLELSEGSAFIGDNDVELSGLQFDDPELPDISLSPAMTLVVAEDVEAEDADD